MTSLGGVKITQKSMTSSIDGPLSQLKFFFFYALFL